MMRSLVSAKRCNDSFSTSTERCNDSSPDATAAMASLGATAAMALMLCLILAIVSGLFLLSCTSI